MLTPTTPAASASTESGGPSTAQLFRAFQALAFDGAEAVRLGLGMAGIRDPESIRDDLQDAAFHIEAR